MEIVIDNYAIILKKAVMLDPENGTTYGKQILYTIFTLYIPLIEADMSNCCRFLHKLALTNLETKIEDIKNKGSNRNASKWTEEKYMSPLVLLLKLGNNRGVISFDQEYNDWGRFWSLCQYFASLNLKEHQAEEERYWPGMPSCMFSIVLVRTSHQIVISASNERFLVTETLQKKGRVFRTARLREMKTSCTVVVREKISNVMCSSHEFKQEYKASKTVLKMEYIEENEIMEFKRKTKLKRTHLTGIVASWSPQGAYKPACLLDYCRFHVLRQPKAEALEQNCWWGIQVKDETGRVTSQKRVTDKKVWNVDFCAEWPAFLELAKVSTATVTEASQWLISTLITLHICGIQRIPSHW